MFPTTLLPWPLVASKRHISAVREPLPSTTVAKIERPSAAQQGETRIDRGSAVRARAFRPEASATQMLSEPLPSLMYAIWEPSGEN